jgi:hypothetical protein
VVPRALSDNSIHYFIGYAVVVSRLVRKSCLWSAIRDLAVHTMNKTKFSLFYLSSYLTIIGFGLLFSPHDTLKIPQSNGYGDVFTRVSGALSHPDRWDRLQVRDCPGSSA